MKFIITSLICFFTLSTVFAQEAPNNLEDSSTGTTGFKKEAIDTFTPKDDKKEFPGKQDNINANDKIKSFPAETTTQKNKEEEKIEYPRTSTQEALAPRTKSKEHTLKAVEFKNKNS